MSDPVIPLDRLRRFARPAVHLAREIPVWPRLPRRGDAPRLVALPARPRADGAARLRIHTMTEALERLGWVTLVLPPGLSLGARQRLIRAFGPDILFMQGMRHALNRPALYPGCPVVMDMDDADFHLPHLNGPLVEAMPQVALLTAGSRYVAEWGRAAGVGRAEVVWTGTPVSSRFRTAPSARPPVVAWAQTRPMTYLREAAIVRRVMAEVGRQRPGVTLRLYDRRLGDDPGFADSFRSAGVTVEWRASVGYDAYLASFDDVAAGLAPLAAETPFSRGKSFGKVLAYLDRKVPVIGSDAGEHGLFFTEETGVITNDESAWVAGILDCLEDAPGRARRAGAAHAAFRARLTTEAAAVRINTFLRETIAAGTLPATA